MVKLPFDDSYLIATEVTNPDHWSLCFNRSLQYFVNKFPALIPPYAIVDSIVEQFTLYQCTDLKDCENVDSHVYVWIVMWINGGLKLVESTNSCNSCCK